MRFTTNRTSNDSNASIERLIFAFLIVAISCIGSQPAQAALGNGDLIGPNVSSKAKKTRSAILLQDDRVEAPQENRPGYLVEVQLPIDSKVSDSVRQTLLKIAEKAPAGAPVNQRPVVVLKFETLGGKTGRGSEVTSCIELALLLGKPELQKIHTVAYIPADTESGAVTQLNGHSVLVAIAANELAMEPETSIGAAGIDDPQIESWVRDVYKTVATQRLTTVPVEVALAMLDPNLGLLQVTTMDQRTIYVEAAARGEWEKLNKSKEIITVASPGNMAVLSRSQLEKFGFIDIKPDSKKDLARELNLIPRSLENSFGSDQSRNAIQINLPNYIDEKSAQWLLLAISREVNREDVNLIILNIDSNEGDIDACLKIAQRLSEFNSDKVRTVAFVREAAIGPVGLLALSCAEVIMSPKSKLGGKREFDADGVPDVGLDSEELAKLKPLVQGIAKRKSTDWSLMMSMIDPSLQIWRYVLNGKPDQTRILSEEEHASLDDSAEWVKLREIGGEAGIDATTAVTKSIAASTIAEDMGQIKTLFQLEEYPRTVQPTATDRWVDKFATFLTSPLVAMMLLFGAMFFFSTEMSAPGLGVPGFLATVCFVLFFWSQNLGGNADVLEILLFLVGVVFVVLEIFVIPGFGIFGVGGLLMIIVSVVLASQSFLIPRTNEELAQIPYSLLPVIGAGFGVIAGAWTLRKVLPNSPYLRRMMLEPRERVETGLEGRSDPEAVVDWSHLAGETGETVTKLYPSGKARIKGKVYDVVSSGNLVDKGEKVIVVEAQGNRIVVKLVE